MTQPEDDFDPAAFQAFCARFGIETTPITDAFGRIDFKLDRANVEKLAYLKRIADSHKDGSP
ncbi:hypothetical protein [Streptacidiphilus melanogenes]|uniref:hypothetical protein n=1 Tax=Streptacidiphilus melanogenes TaxID=411235 RepID=UPI0005AA2FA7|nr:hypothetical protein [Streptacidiphilus melanogenes]